MTSCHDYHPPLTSQLLTVGVDKFTKICTKSQAIVQNLCPELATCSSGRNRKTHSWCWLTLVDKIREREMRNRVDESQRQTEECHEDLNRQMSKCLLHFTIVKESLKRKRGHLLHKLLPGVGFKFTPSCKSDVQRWMDWVSLMLCREELLFDSSSRLHHPYWPFVLLRSMKPALDCVVFLPTILFSM